MTTIPVIYIHFGAIPDYFIKSIKCASAFNKNIIVLTDIEFNFKNPNVKCFPISNYPNDIDKFDAVYKHMSTNSAEFEARCIKRWFILRNFIEEQNLEQCYYSDSDVMIYDDMNRVYSNYIEYDAAFTMVESQDNYTWAASGCCSYWKRNTLNQFCSFILKMYSAEKIGIIEEKWAYHQKNQVAGGICDMTLLYLFSKEINFYSLSKVKNGSAFDHNILTAENYYPAEYEMEKVSNRLIKKLTWENGLPYGNNLRLGEKIRFIAITEYAKLIEGPKLVGSILRRIKSSLT